MNQGLKIGLVLILLVLLAWPDYSWAITLRQRRIGQTADSAQSSPQPSPQSNPQPPSPLDYLLYFLIQELQKQLKPQQPQVDAPAFTPLLQPKPQQPERQPQLQKPEKLPPEVTSEARELPPPPTGQDLAERIGLPPGHQVINCIKQSPNPDDHRFACVVDDGRGNRYPIRLRNTDPNTKLEPDLLNSLKDFIS